MIAFAIIFSIFFLFIILSVAFSNRKILALNMVALALLTIVAGPMIAYEYVEKNYKNVEYKSIKFRQLQFKNEAVIRGFLVNRSKKILSNCKIEGKLYKKSDSTLKKFFNLAKPQSRAKTFTNGKLLPNMVLGFTLNFKNITYKDELEISLKTRCR